MILVERGGCETCMFRAVRSPVTMAKVEVSLGEEVLQFRDEQLTMLWKPGSAWHMR